ncbi:hypothetical protein COHA_004377 [Chlorella ohadii]|uniref:sulfiredoxin n=1 Tax=Chlorella ohadii TaxID=2649997 RepID=A0AAD5H5P9_9CHLO|nr:hypothetical protein COHA_004377 [Chlorella ohadii]
MAWSFGTQVQGRLSPSGRPLKRPASRECLAPHVKHPAVAAAVPPGGSSEAVAAAAAAAASPAADVNVAAVAAKHGWDLQQRNDYSNDRQEPIDVLEVDGKIYGFSGCHRFEAHVRLGREQILCRVRKATPQVLKFHMM